jgi:signal peptidase II
VKKNTALFIFPAIAVILLDQLTKYLVARNLQVGESFSIIENYFNLVHVRNRGMAFGLMNRPGDDGSGHYFLIGATFIAAAILIYWFFKLRGEKNWMIPGLSLVLGGAVGNLIDRLRIREVVDFLDFYIGTLHWPAFNIADAAITVGTFWIAIQLIFRPALLRGNPQYSPPK